MKESGAEEFMAEESRVEKSGVGMSCNYFTRELDGFGIF